MERTVSLLSFLCIMAISLFEFFRVFFGFKWSVYFWQGYFMRVELVIGWLLESHVLELFLFKVLISKKLWFILFTFKYRVLHLFLFPDISNFLFSFLIILSYQLEGMVWAKEFLFFLDLYPLELIQIFILFRRQLEHISFIQYVLMVLVYLLLNRYFFLLFLLQQFKLFI